MAKKFPKINKKQQNIDPRTPENPKQNKYKNENRNLHT